MSGYFVVRYIVCPCVLYLVIYVFPIGAYPGTTNGAHLYEKSGTKTVELSCAYHIIELSPAGESDGHRSRPLVSLTKQGTHDNDNATAVIDTITHYLEDEVPDHENVRAKNVSFQKKPRTILYIIPRFSYIKDCIRAFFSWFKKKDTEYAEDTEESHVRKEWEVWLGVDIFHTYYKYKEAQDIVKEKFSLNTHGITVSPEYTNRQFKLILRKKF